MKRIFAAVKIETSKQLLNIYNELKSACKFDRINWVEPVSMHITLKFFGETEEDIITDIQEHLVDIAENHESFDITLNNIGIFGSYYKPRVIWIGIEPNNALEKLGNDMINRMEPLGFERDRQNFIPHLTIGRIKFTDNKKLFQQTIDRYNSQFIQEQKIDRFYLIESKLGTKGPTYFDIENYPLKKGFP